MGGVFFEVYARVFLCEGARFLLSGSDHNLLMAGATARSKFLRTLEP